jgi:hypothetical protein
MVTVISDAYHLKTGSLSCWVLEMWHTYCWKICGRKFGQSLFVHISEVRTLCLDNWVAWTTYVMLNEMFPHSTAWLKKIDSISYVYICWTIHGMWMIYITFERGGPKFSYTTGWILNWRRTHAAQQSPTQF